MPRSSYNRVDGVYSCENARTLAGDLKRGLGFGGFVISDWRATRSTALVAGLDVEQPGASFMNASAIKALLVAGKAAEADVDDAVVRILTSLFAVGVMDAPSATWDYKKLLVNVSTAAAIRSARRLAAQSLVLVKNSREMLPLSLPSSMSPSPTLPTAAVPPKLSLAAPATSIALIGYCADNAVVSGGGSGYVAPSFLSTPLDAIRERVGSAAKVSYVNGTSLEEAVALARSHSVAIVCAATESTEAQDRISLSLDDGCDDCVGNAHAQNALIDAVASANPRTVVLLSVPGAILTPWRDAVAAIVVGFAPGQEFGHAAADVLFGDVNPSARLPLTLPSLENETSLTPSQWPGVPAEPGAQCTIVTSRAPGAATPQNCRAHYKEGLLIGYRFYDAYGVQPAYPFGHGLSYTSFEYSRLQVSGVGSDGINVTFMLHNSGLHAGAEVAQLYLAYPPGAGEPPRVLRRFVKVMLGAGESSKVSFEALSPDRDLATWSEEANTWQRVTGEFGVLVGASSRDIRLHGTVPIASRGD